ncbi:Ras and EF-hand domain-containing [Nymphon striatum]|nr:Ras and EF-hand domain-containing [Nymphon striatum]
MSVFKTDSGLSTLRGDTTFSDHEDDIEYEMDDIEKDIKPTLGGEEVGEIMKKRLISKLNIKPVLTTQVCQLVIPLDECDQDDEQIKSDEEECKEVTQKQISEVKIFLGEPNPPHTEPPLPKKRTRLPKASDGLGFVTTIPEIEESVALPEAMNEKFYEPTGPPDTTYKVVFVGDAAVGKSSFIIRLSKGLFQSNLSSTLGVDFQMKTLNVDFKNIAVQLWDTAGQERFRSITQSYFRRADGIMLLYDCTSERSFLNVREWAEAIRDVTDRTIPVMLCSNKTDLRDDAIAEGRSVVRKEDGERLAKESNYIFIEASAKSGSNVILSIVDLIRIMQKNVDLELQATGLKITDGKKKKSCCS